MPNIVLYYILDTNYCIYTAYGMVPHLTAVLGTMLPMLGMAKHENMRWVFSSGMYVPL